MIADAAASPIVVISWWSNCLTLACLHALDVREGDRDVYVVQVGKSPDQQAAFRRCAPPHVKELPYDVTAPAEHSRVLEYVARTALRGEAGVWFVDHDVLMRAPLERWLRRVDSWLTDRTLCLCLPPDGGGPAITQPAFWMSPVRWPQGIASLDPLPFRASDTARRPDLFSSSEQLMMPQKDTMVQARDELAQRALVANFPLPFPDHVHLGGVSLFSGRTLPPADEWTRATVARFADFFATCPREWVAIEEPTLLRRLSALDQAYHG